MDAAEGATIHLGSWTVTGESVKAYLEAVGDDQDVYRDAGAVPPLALCAWTLGAMLEKLSLPAGTVHSIQEMEARQAVAVGEKIHALALPERPRTRGGLRFMTVGYTLKNGAGNIVQTGKTTVLTPDEGDKD